KPRAKYRPGKLQRKVGTDRLIRNEIFEARPRSGARVIMKLDSLVNTPEDRIAHRGIEMPFGHTLAELKITLIEQVVAWGCYPDDIAKPAADADPCTVLGIVDLARDYATSPQLRVGCLLVLAGALDVYDGVAGNPAFSLKLGAELARRAYFHVIGKELVVGGGGAPLDDDAVRL